MKIGDYVRTKYGIAKFIDYEIKSLGIIVIDRYIAYDHDTGYRNIITSDEIINSDPDIKKLILTGDYVRYKQGKYFSDQYYVVNGILEEIIKRPLRQAQGPRKKLYLWSLSLSKGAMTRSYDYGRFS